MVDIKFSELTEKSIPHKDDLLAIADMENSLNKSVKWSTVTSPVDITYANLVAAIIGSTLLPGRMYRITDYATVHTIPNTDDINTGPTEPLIVKAIAVNKLAPEAYSETYPQDIIYYNPANDTSKITGSTKGFIYRRIDTVQNNDFPFDFRNVKFRRWQIEVTTVDATGAVGDYTKGNVVLKTGTTEIYIKLNDQIACLFTDTSSWKRFEWNNLDYVSTTETSWFIIDNSFTVNIPCSALYIDYKMFAQDSYYTTAYSNKIEQNSSNILVQSNSVIFGSNFNNNSIGSNFNNNSIGSYFSSNSIGSNFNNNSIGSYFNSNSIGSNFYNNSIGSNFNNNSIGSYFSSNSIGSNFYYNSIGNNINNFICFLSNVTMNTFEDNMDYTSIDFSSATHIVGSYSCRLYTDKTDGLKLSYVDEGVLTVVAVNS